MNKVKDTMLVAGAIQWNRFMLYNLCDKWILRMHRALHNMPFFLTLSHLGVNYLL